MLMTLKGPPVSNHFTSQSDHSQQNITSRQFGENKTILLREPTETHLPYISQYFLIQKECIKTILMGVLKTALFKINHLKTKLVGVQNTVGI